MHIIITDAWLTRGRTVYLSGWRLLGMGAAAVGGGLVLLALAYHTLFMHGVRQSWPIFRVADAAFQSAQTDAQNRFLRENLDAMARRLGEMQARMLQMESLTERVLGLSGLKPQENPAPQGAGGALVLRDLSMAELSAAISAVDEGSVRQVDWLTAVESSLFDQKIQRSLVPTAEPVSGVGAGSRFGFRIDPFTGRSALHTGLDFPAPTGTPILAAAGGVVVVQERHAAYGNMVEIDHGGDLVTRYAHGSEVFVKKGDIVKRGQKIAAVGSTGRSTGPHLHFEVWVAGVPQDPQKFLQAGRALSVAKAPTDLSSP